jgi:hypothetical protein
MADDPETPNTLTSSARSRSVARGDIPEAMRRRYYTDERGGAGLGFYADATVQRPAFRDEGRRLVAARADPGAIRDMAMIAQHRGWTIVTARGSPEFRREAWLAGRTLGLEVRGYRPTERDVQELDRRIDRRLAARERTRREREDEPLRRDPPERGRDADAGVRSRLRVVEAVVRDRVADPSARDRILTTARERIADWLERGARFESLGVGRTPEAVAEAARGRERGRVR